MALNDSPVFSSIYNINGNNATARKMRIRDRLSDFISGGKMSSLQKSNETMHKAMRPGIPSFDFAPQYSNRTWLGWCYFFEHEVSIFSDIASKIRDETFRNGLEFRPAFLFRCKSCGMEYNEEIEECTRCGHDDFSQPDYSQLEWANRLNDVSYLEAANLNEQSMLDVLKNGMYHLVIADNMYILCIKKYLLDDEGNIIKQIPYEFISLDPRDVVIMFDQETGELGQYKTCLEHRMELYDDEDTVCKKCGKKLYPVHYQVQAPTQNLVYYVKDEICHVCFYYPNLLYGFPKALKLADELWTYHYIEKRVRSYYEYARAMGLLFIPSENQDALMEAWVKIMEQVKEDPHTIPAIGTSEKAPTQANFVKLLEDPNGELIAIKDELRDRIASGFGVTMTFVNDTSNTGGMKNDENLISLSDRTIASFQDAMDNKPLRWITKMMGITDFELVCIPHITENDMDKEELFAMILNNARTMSELNYKSAYHEKDGRRWFTYREMTPEEIQQKSQEQFGGFMGGGQPGMEPGMEGEQPQEGEETMDGEEPAGDEETPDDGEFDSGKVESANAPNNEKKPPKSAKDLSDEEWSDMFSKANNLLKGLKCAPGFESHPTYRNGECHPKGQKHRGMGNSEPPVQSKKPKKSTGAQGNKPSPEKIMAGASSKKPSKAAQKRAEQGKGLKNIKPEPTAEEQKIARATTDRIPMKYEATADLFTVNAMIEKRINLGNSKKTGAMGKLGENVFAALVLGYKAHERDTDVEDFQNHYMVDIKTMSQEETPIMYDQWMRKLKACQETGKKWRFVSITVQDDGLTLREHTPRKDFYEPTPEQTEQKRPYMVRLAEGKVIGRVMRDGSFIGMTGMGEQNGN